MDSIAISSIRKLVQQHETAVTSTADDAMDSRNSYKPSVTRTTLLCHRDRFGYTPLHWVCASSKAPVDLVRVLLQADAPIYESLRMPPSAESRLLLEQETMTRSTDPSSENPSNNIHSNDTTLEMVDLTALEYSPKYESLSPWVKTTPLHLACRYGAGLEVLRVLLQHDEKALLHQSPSRSNASYYVSMAVQIDRFGKFPIDYICDQWEPNTEYHLVAIQLLLERAPSTMDWFLLRMACKSNADVTILNYLLETILSNSQAYEELPQRIGKIVRKICRSHASSAVLQFLLDNSLEDDDSWLLVTDWRGCRSVDYVINNPASSPASIAMMIEATFSISKRLDHLHHEGWRKEIEDKLQVLVTEPDAKKRPNHQKVLLNRLEMLEHWEVLAQLDTVFWDLSLGESDKASAIRKQTSLVCSGSNFALPKVLEFLPPFEPSSSVNSLPDHIWEWPCQPCYFSCCGGYYYPSGRGRPPSETIRARDEPYMFITWVHNFGEEVPDVVEEDVVVPKMVLVEQEFIQGVTRSSVTK